MIPYHNRFHGHNSLRYVYKNGQAFRSRLVILRCIPNTHRKKSRVAVVVSKKVLKSAVKRNRIRRRIYEYLRLKLPEFNKTYDVVLIVSSSEVLDMPYSDLVKQLDQLLEQAGLVEKNSQS